MRSDNASSIEESSDRAAPRGAEFIEWLRMRARDRTTLCLAIAIGLFSIFAIGIALTKRPWCDEGWFADIAYNVMHHGVMGLTVLDPHGFVFAPYVKGIEQHTYWVLPGYILMQVAWYSVLGFSLFTMRLLSVAWGAVALLSWYVVVRRLSESQMVALIATLILALDQNFIIAGASGRMDMMCAGLGLAASAIYLQMRARFQWAIFTASSVLAGALITHPNALFGAILLTLLVLFLDRDRISWRMLLIAALPFAIVLSVWSVYVLQAPQLFVAQMQAQSKIPHRFEFHWNLLRQFRDELTGRYMRAYHLGADAFNVKSTGAVALLYLSGVFGVAFIADIRRRPGVKLMAGLVLLTFTLLSCLQDNWYYLVYTLPGFSALVAYCIVGAWERKTLLFRVIILAACSAIILNLVPIGVRILHNDYQGRYIAAADYLKKNLAPNDLVMASAELAFDLGFDGRVLDDCRLGFLSGRRPTYIVLEAQYYRFWFPWLLKYEPESHRYIERLLKDDYEIVYDQTHDNLPALGLSELPYIIYREKVR